MITMKELSWQSTDFHNSDCSFCICSVDTRVMFLGVSSIPFYVWRPALSIPFIHSTVCLLHQLTISGRLYPCTKQGLSHVTKKTWRLLSFPRKGEKCLFMVMVHFKKSCWHRHAAWLQPALDRYFTLHVLSYGDTFTEGASCRRRCQSRALWRQFNIDCSEWIIEMGAL